MDIPPPVPPKDSPYRRAMHATHTPSAPASGSKRKREPHDDNIYDLRDGRLEVPADADAYTPKRNRSNVRQSDNDASDDATPAKQRTVRRKKGLSNLSNINLRHAAERQAAAQAQYSQSDAEDEPHAASLQPPRPSKFQEGSLTDKPSSKPPSAFTRIIRSDSGNVLQVDELMADYHDGMLTPPGATAEDEIAREKRDLPARVAAIAAQNEAAAAAQASQENNGILFRFGRSLAASFHPIKMWKQVWEESTEELRQKNLQELERKRILKEEAERRYAQMKASGQFVMQPVSRASNAETSTPRDSGIAMSSAKGSQEHTRNVSYGSQLAPPADDTHSRSESEAPETGSKVVKTIRSRLGFKRPSLNNLRFDLKRAKSDYNLAAAADANRESSSSISPVKMDIDDSLLRKSHSKIDLKKQHKLSKRVSDLETKLQLARRELNEALVDASPMPKLNSRYERFTPNSTLKRPKFAMPTTLPSLPSERLLDPSQLGFEPDEEDNVMSKNEARAQAAAALEGNSEPRQGLNLTNMQDDETIRVSRAGTKAYPPRASSLFTRHNTSIEHNTTSGADEMDDNATQNSQLNGESQDVIMAEDHQPTAQTNDSASYETLDAKLKALDKDVKVSKKSGKGKKRKSAGADDKTYRPGASEDEEAEFEEAKGKSKKRKSSGSKKTATAAQSDLPATTKKASKKAAAASDPVIRVNDEDLDTAGVAEEEPDPEQAASVSVRTSIDSISVPLEPVAEASEEEDAMNQGVPASVTVRHHIRSASRNSSTRMRSTSPSKPARPGCEEKLMTRAARAAQENRATSESFTGAVPEDDAAVVVVPGHEGVPSLPKGANGSFESLAVPGAEVEVVKSRKGRGRPKKISEGFEWPDDVF